MIFAHCLYEQRDEFLLACDFVAKQRVIRVVSVCDRVVFNLLSSTYVQQPLYCSVTSQLKNILVPRALLTRGATRGSGQIHIKLASDWLQRRLLFLCRIYSFTMFLWYPVLDLARAPRRTARKKGSGYENELKNHWTNCWWCTARVRKISLTTFFAFFYCTEYSF